MAGSTLLLASATCLALSGVLPGLVAAQSFALRHHEASSRDALWHTMCSEYPQLGNALISLGLQINEIAVVRL